MRGVTKLLGASNAAQRNFAQREALRTDSLVLKSLGRLIDLCSRTINGDLRKDDYVAFMCAVAKALWKPDEFDLGVVRQSIEKDWDAENGQGYV